ncbi:MAG: hypothetical protein KGJ07_06500, partial [Patescibacteria group bacterium]|nr:hypothetical protein [Patescibacteria group bacterium]
MTEILAASKAGYNVLTETDPNNFIFHSSYNTFKILVSGTASIAATTGNNTITVTHNMNSKNGFYIIYNNDVFTGGLCELLRTVASYVQTYDGSGNPTGNTFIYDAYNTLN